MELRRHARVPLETSVSYYVKGDTQQLPGRSHDISLGGIFILTNRPPAFNATVTVTVTLPGQTEELTLPGIVRWTRADGMGVQFGLLGARETFAITEYVRAKEA